MAISPQLQSRIDNFTGAGSVSDEEMQAFNNSVPEDPNADLRARLAQAGAGSVSDEEMMMQSARSQAQSPD